MPSLGRLLRSVYRLKIPYIHPSQFLNLTLPFNQRAVSYSQHTHKQLYRMDIVYFRNQSEDGQMHINFHYKDDDTGLDRAFNLMRCVSEPVDTCLDRIRANIEKEVEKRNRKKKGKAAKNKTNQPSDVTIATPINVQLLRDGVPLTQITLFDVFAGGREAVANMYLMILKKPFRVALNLPWVNAVTLTSSMLAGYYTYPCKLDMEFANMTDTTFQWFRSAEVCTVENEASLTWIPVGDKFYYQIPTDIMGHKIKLVCTPRSGDLTGPSAEHIAKTKVDASPGLCPFQTRQLFTETSLSGRKFRVVTYNLLADLYADSDYTRKHLFPYCPPYALDIDYRKQLFMRELLGYNADVICLQEVDAKIFDYDLMPMLCYWKYAGAFQRKGTTAEGVAIFFNSVRFELVKSYGINIGANLPKLPIFAELWSKIQQNQQLADRICDRSTAIQIIVLRARDEGKILLVANTHLYFHPDADHIRLLQFGAAMRYVQYVHEQTVDDLNLASSDVSIVFCGDFNSVPECGIYKLMTERFVPADFVDFQSNEAEALNNVTLTQPFNMKSAYGAQEPQYTNYTVGFTACLDYIFYQTDNLRVLQAIQTPSEEELQAHTAIPSVVFPSDHVALLSDLEWIS